MSSRNDRHWELSGYGLWVIGSAAFAAVAIRDGDVLSLVASVLFLVGILAVMVPLARRERADHGPDFAED